MTHRQVTESQTPTRLWSGAEGSRHRDDDSGGRASAEQGTKVPWQHRGKEPKSHGPVGKGFQKEVTTKLRTHELALEQSLKGSDHGKAFQVQETKWVKHKTVKQCKLLSGNVKGDGGWDRIWKSNVLLEREFYLIIQV